MYQLLSIVHSGLYRISECCLLSIIISIHVLTTGNYVISPVSNLEILCIEQYHQYPCSNYRELYNLAIIEPRDTEHLIVSPVSIYKLLVMVRSRQ